MTRMSRIRANWKTEANEGSEDSGGYGLDFLQKATKRTKIFAAAEDKAFVLVLVAPAPRAAALAAFPPVSLVPLARLFVIFC